jgi:hypothetical protein
MKILPKRSMRLGGKDVQAGKPAEVSKADADLAIRHGWAVIYDKDAAKAVEARNKSAEAAAAAAKAEEAKKAKAEWDGSEELRTQYPEFADYLASLDEVGEDNS